MSKNAAVKYENNPFYIAYNGVTLLFKSAQSIGIFAAVLAGIGLLGNGLSNIASVFTPYEEEPTDAATGEAMPFVFDETTFAIIASIGLVAVIIGLIFTLISLFLYGILEYTAAKLANDETVQLEHAFSGVWKQFPGYIWVYIIVFTKIFLWTLLFIIPGIIMSIRYSLAGVAYFAENQRGNAAIKRSLALTKGAWFTTFAGYGLGNMITLGLATSIVNPAASTILFRQLRAVTDRGETKPPTHWLSWLTFFVPIVLALLFIVLIVFFAVLLVGTLS